MTTVNSFDAHAEALNLLDRLKNNVKFITQKDELKRRKEMKKKPADRLRRILSWNSMTFQHFERLQVSNKFEILPVDFEQLLSKLPRIKKYDEFLLKKVIIEWKPYISSNMQGITTILMGDFRSRDQRNVLKGGYTFPTSQSFSNGVIYPGYVVSTKDVNLNKIFRFYILTAGLDLDTSSFCGRLTLKFECQVGDSSFNIPLQGNELLIVKSAGSMTLAQTEPGPSMDLIQDISSEEIIETIQSFESLRVKKMREKEEKSKKKELVVKGKDDDKDDVESMKGIMTDFSGLNQLLNLPSMVDLSRRMSCSDLSQCQNEKLKADFRCDMSSEIKEVGSAFSLEEIKEDPKDEKSESEPSFFKKNPDCGCSRLVL